MELNEILDNITILKNCHTFNVLLLISLFIVDIAIYCAIYSFIEDKINDAILTPVLESIAIVVTSTVMACGTLVLARHTDIVFQFKWYVETDCSVSQFAEYFKVNEVTVVDGKTMCYIEPHSEYHRVVMDHELQRLRSGGEHEIDAAN